MSGPRVILVYQDFSNNLLKNNNQKKQYQQHRDFRVLPVFHMFSVLLNCTILYSRCKFILYVGTFYAFNIADAGATKTKAFFHVNFILIINLCIYKQDTTLLNVNFCIANPGSPRWRRGQDRGTAPAGATACTAPGGPAGETGGRRERG